MSTPIILTSEGYKKLKEELAYLKGTRRAEIAEKIKEARDFGDLSENSEYDAAQNELAITEARIRDIEEQMKHIEVVDGSDIDTNHVSVGSIVRIKDCEFPEDGEMEYMIVGKTESNPGENKISDQCPMGKALLGKKKGSKVTVSAPGGDFMYEIIDIRLPE